MSFQNIEALKTGFIFEALPAKLEKQFGTDTKKIIDTYRHSIPKASASDIWVAITSINNDGFRLNQNSRTQFNRRERRFIYTISDINPKPKCRELIIHLEHRMQWINF